ncbi:MAG: hypothetical protein AAB719_01960 [Patescibacteria group bacterium]
MKTLSQNKTIIGAIAVFITLILLYNVFLKADPELIPDELAASTIGEDLIRTHAELQRVTLDTALFSSPNYQRLVDFNLTIPAQPTGRTNPFDIIGRD